MVFVEHEHTLVDVFDHGVQDFLAAFDNLRGLVQNVDHVGGVDIAHRNGGCHHDARARRTDDTGNQAFRIVYQRCRGQTVEQHFTSGHGVLGEDLIGLGFANETFRQLAQFGNAYIA